MNWIALFQIAQWLLRIGMFMVVLRRRFAPPTALAWISIIFFEPIIGTALYLLIGDRRLGRKRVRLHRELVMKQHLMEAQPELAEHVVRPVVNEANAQIILQAERYGEMAILSGNQVELLDDTQATIDRMIADIDAAEHHVHVLFYIFVNDGTGRRFAEALMRAARRGVECRVLADYVGSRPFFKRGELAHTMRQAGVHVRPALPVMLIRTAFARIDLRNHRKILVVDGRIGYTGSQNVVNADYGHRRAAPWHDLMGRFQGPVVNQLQSVFIEDWAFETDEMLDTDTYLPMPQVAGEMAAQVVATGPSYRRELVAIPRVMLAAINSARRRIIMTTPYLIPDEPMVMALSMAADRGVRIDVVVPRRGDQILPQTAGRYYFDRLLEAGINVHLHQHGLLHAKTMTVDDSFALLGSTNLDMRSFYLNFEINVLMYGHAITGQLRFAQSRYVNESRQLDVDQWRQRSTWRRVGQSAAALFSPLL